MTKNAAVSTRMAFALLLGIGMFSIVGNVVPYITYLKYIPALPALIISFAAMQKYGPVSVLKKNVFFSAFAILTFFGIISILLDPNYYTFVDTCIYASIMCVGITLSNVRIGIDFIFKWFVFSATVWLVINLYQFGAKSFSLSWSEAFYSSHSDLEYSVIGYISGIFLIHYFLAKKKTAVLLCLIFCILSSKRATLIALLAVTVVSLCPQKVRTYLFTRKAFLLLNCTWVGLSYVIAAPWFANMTVNFFGVDANILTQGRHALYSIATSDANKFNIISFKDGMSAELLRDAISNFHFRNANRILLHNEPLRVYLEFGAIGFFLFFSLLFPFHVNFKRYEKCDAKSVNEVLYICLFLNVVMLVDNVILYVQVWYVAILILVSIIYGSKQPSVGGVCRTRSVDRTGVSV